MTPSRRTALFFPQQDIVFFKANDKLDTVVEISSHE